jgi:choline dehydrogenase-like flavoprotein
MPRDRLLVVTYDLAIVGTGFASSFFLREYLRHARANARVLVVERGARETRQWQLANRTSSRIDPATTFRRSGLPAKTWQFTIGFGGGSNCWWGCTPRLLPSDFRMRSTYGVGDDWPLDYADLEPFYEDAETIMSISASDRAPYPRRVTPPQPPHRFSDPDRLLATAYPDLYFPQPTARARVPTEGRTACCASGVCGLCPIDAKFTIENGLRAPYEDARVTLRLEEDVQSIETRAGRATGFVTRSAAGDTRFDADLVVVGAGAIFNPAILLRSGIGHAVLGRRLFEQVSVSADIDLDGVNGFGGSTVFTASGYMLYDGPHRASHAACLMESWNRPDSLRWEPGRERQLLHMKFILEDLPQTENRVTVASDGTPHLHFTDYSQYAYRGIERVSAEIDRMLAPLPVERLDFDPTPSSTEGHILGTVVMGSDPATSVVDPWMIHHQIRNLLVIGGSGFPTGSPTNPTLTISALSLRSAAHLVA